MTSLSGGDNDGIKDDNNSSSYLHTYIHTFSFLYKQNKEKKTD